MNYRVIDLVGKAAYCCVKKFKHYICSSKLWITDLKSLVGLFINSKSTSNNNRGENLRQIIHDSYEKLKLIQRIFKTYQRLKRNSYWNYYDIWVFNRYRIGDVLLETYLTYGRTRSEYFLTAIIGTLPMKPQVFAGLYPCYSTNPPYIKTPYNLRVLEPTTASLNTPIPHHCTIIIYIIFFIQ